MPLAPQTQLGRYEIRDILMDQRRFDEAITQYKKTLELDPNFPTTQLFLARAYEAKGMYDQAVAQYAVAGRFTGVPPEVLAEANRAYARSGWKAYLQKCLDYIVTQMPSRQFPPFAAASYYARLGKNEEALHWLQQGYEERDFRLRHISVMFEFDNLRSDSRFIELSRKMGLPQ